MLVRPQNIETINVGEEFLTIKQCALVSQVLSIEFEEEIPRHYTTVDRITYDDTGNGKKLIIIWFKGNLMRCRASGFTWNNFDMRKLEVGTKYYKV